jgi:flagellar hook-length control protein FliK
MPAAANLIGLKPVAPESAPGVAPPAELFATLVAAIGPGAETPVASPTPEAEAGAEGDRPEGEEAAVDASILLPMLDQSRAAAPAAIAVAIPAASSVEAVATADPAIARPGEPNRPAASAAPAALCDVPRTVPEAAADVAGEKSSGAAKAAVEVLAPKSATSEAGAKEVQAATAEPRRAADPRIPAPDPRSQAPAAPAPNALPSAAPGAAQPNVTAQSVAAVLANPTGPTQVGKPSRQTAANRTGEAPATGEPPSAKAAAAQVAAAAAAPATRLPRLTVDTDRPLPELAAVTQTGREPAASALIQPLGTSPITMMSAAPAQAPVQNLGAALAGQMLDLARGGEWVDQLARDIARSAASDGTMRFRLAPETLGELRVEITHSERGAHVRLHVTSEAAQQALAEAQPKLVQEARAQGVRIAEAEVSLTGGQGQSERQGREAARQATAEQPLRSLRNHVPNDTSNGDRRGNARMGRTDLYA